MLAEQFFHTLDDSDLERLHWATAQEIDRRGGHVDSYAAPHIWNLVAKILRENYSVEPSITDTDLIDKLASRRAVEEIALAFARRFAEDEGFDPIAWLDKCSPDPEAFPFSELWEEVEL